MKKLYAWGLWTCGDGILFHIGGIVAELEKNKQNDGGRSQMDKWCMAWALRKKKNIKGRLTCARKDENLWGKPRLKKEERKQKWRGNKTIWVVGFFGNEGNVW